MTERADNAGLFARAAAFLIDLALAAVFSCVLSVALPFVLALFMGGDPDLVAWSMLYDRAPALLKISVLFSLFLPLYFALSEASKQQATVGKKRMGVHLADAKGGRASLLQAALRYIIFFAPPLLFAAASLTAFQEQYARVLENINDISRIEWENLYVTVWPHVHNLWQALLFYGAFSAAWLCVLCLPALGGPDAVLLHDMLLRTRVCDDQANITAAETVPAVSAAPETPALPAAQRGGAVARTGALFLDCVLIAMCCLVLYLPFSGGGKEGLFIFGHIVFWLAAAAYFIGFESSRMQATPGKWLTGLYVAAEDNAPASRAAILRRFFIWAAPGLFLSAALLSVAGNHATGMGAGLAAFAVLLGATAATAIALFLFYIIPILFSKEAAGMQDRLSRTRVYNRRSARAPATAQTAANAAASEAGKPSFFRGDISILAIIAGWLVNMAANDLLVSLLIHAFKTDSTATFMVQLLLGALSLMLAGSAAGAVAKNDRMLNGALAAFFCAVLTTVKAAGTATFAFLLLSPFLGALGAWPIRSLLKRPAEEPRETPRAALARLHRQTPLAIPAALLCLAAAAILLLSTHATVFRTKEVAFEKKAEENFTLHLTQAAEVPIRYPDHSEEWPGGAAWSPDGRTLAVAGFGNKFLNVFDREGHAVFANTTAYRGGISHSLAFLDNSRVVLSHYHNMDTTMLDIRDAKTGEVVEAVPMPPPKDLTCSASTCDFTLSPDKKFAFVPVFNGAALFDAAGWKLLTTITRWSKSIKKEVDDDLKSPHFLADGTLVFLSGKSVLYFRAGTEILEAVVQGHGKNSLVSVSPSMAFILVSNTDLGDGKKDFRKVRLQVRSHKDMLSTAIRAASMHDIVWDPKGRYIAFLEENRLDVWQTAPGGGLKVMTLPEEARGLAVTDDGNALAVTWGRIRYPDAGGGVTIFSIQ